MGKTIDQNDGPRNISVKGLGREGRLLLEKAPRHDCEGRNASTPAVGLSVDQAEQEEDDKELVHKAEDTLMGQ